MKLYESLRFVASFRLFMLLMIFGTITCILTIHVSNAQQEQIGIGDKVSVKVTRGGIQNSSINVQSTNQIGTNVNVSSTTEAQISYNTSYQNSVADSSNTLTVQTDKHLYKSGDLVKVEGTVWSGLISTVGGIDTVSIQVRNDNGTVIYSGRSNLNSDDSYSTSFQLPSDVKNGCLTLETKADVSQDVLNTLTFKMQAGLDTITKFAVMGPNSWPIKVQGSDFEISIASNSQISNVKFDAQAKKISFTVTGENGTEGVADITIPKSLLSGDLTAMIDGQSISQSNVIELDSQDSTTLEINYHHSSHEIEIVGTNAVPEFSVSIMTFGIALSSLLIFTLFNNRIRII